MYRVLVITAVLTVATSLPVPSYVDKCTRSDPKLNECALRVAKKTFSNIINGDRKYNIPSLNPLKITQIKVIESKELNIILNDGEIGGIPDTNILDVKMDSKTLETEIHVLMPKLEIIGNYEIDGKVLVLPIKGKGAANVSLTGIDAVYKLTLAQTKKADGKVYIVPSDAQLDFKPSGFHIDLENLFNGDKALGEHTNKFLNENWEDVVQELRPAISDAVRQVITDILTAVFNLVPLEEVFEK